jgi:hypothetical protein
LRLRKKNQQFLIENDILKQAANAGNQSKIEREKYHCFTPPIIFLIFNNTKGLWRLTRMFQIQDLQKYSP